MSYAFRLLFFLWSPFILIAQDTILPTHYVEAATHLASAYQASAADEAAAFAALRRRFPRYPARALFERMNIIVSFYPAATYPYDSTDYASAKYKPRIASTPLSAADTRAMVAHAPLLELVAAGVLTPDSAYSVRTAQPRIAPELALYDLQDGQAVAEIGAGTGWFALWLAATLPNSPVYVNEIDVLITQSIAAKIADHPAVFGRDRVRAVLGKKNSTGLPPASCDRIIVRNAFHHFKRMNRMLVSIEEALRPGGVLFVAEPLILPGSSPPQHADGRRACPLVRPRLTIIDDIVQRGWRLTGETAAGDWYVLRFEPPAGR